MLQSLLGIAVLLGVGFLCSENRKQISWRAVSGAFGIILVVAGFVLATDIGADVLLSVSSAVGKVFSYGTEGIKFAFGSLVNFSVDGMVLPTTELLFGLIQCYQQRSLTLHEMCPALAAIHHQ